MHQRLPVPKRGRKSARARNRTHPRVKSREAPSSHQGLLAAYPLPRGLAASMHTLHALPSLCGRRGPAAGLRCKMALLACRSTSPHPSCLLIPAPRAVGTLSSLFFLISRCGDALREATLRANKLTSCLRSDFASLLAPVELRSLCCAFVLVDIVACLCGGWERPAFVEICHLRVIS